jgi:hypothetical protein
MSVRGRDAVLTASALGLELSDWIEQRFPLPSPDLLDLGHATDPDGAASTLRQHWVLEERPIGNLLSLLEPRVFAQSHYPRTLRRLIHFHFSVTNKPATRWIVAVKL